MSQPLTHGHNNFVLAEYDVPETEGGPGYTLTYHEVTAEENGRTVNVPGGVQVISEGEILVPGPAGDVYYVLPSGTIQEYERTARGDEFGDPADHTASEVKRRVTFLREKGRDEEADALVELESEGRNRKSALN